MKLKYKQQGKEKEIEFDFLEVLKVYWWLLLAELITVAAVFVTLFILLSALFFRMSGF